MGNAFLDGTAVRAVAPGSYAGEIDELWNLRPLPQGGIVTAMALRAMAAELEDSGERLRTLHTSFVAQVAHGPVAIDVDMLRRGRSVSHLRAEVRNAGSDRGHITTGIFGRTRRGFSFVDAQFPEGLPAPDDCRSFRDPPPPEFDFEPMPFWQKVVEGRPALGHAPWDDYEPERAERAAWYRFDDPPFRDDGTLDPFALVVFADTMPGAVGEILPHDRTWFAPSVDLTVHLLDDCRSSWVLGYNTARFAGDGYASADMTLWDCGDDGRGSPRLVAYATQIFLFSFLEQP
jgi:acyl-CoA thioesterase